MVICGGDIESIDLCVAGLKETFDNVVTAEATASNDGNGPNLCHGYDAQSN